MMFGFYIFNSYINGAIMQVLLNILCDLNLLYNLKISVNLSRCVLYTIIFFTERIEKQIWQVL